MRAIPLLLCVTAPLVLAGCHPSGARSNPQPDLASDRWRALVGCYDLGDQQFALDAASDQKITHERGIRVARFGPQPPIVGGYWFVTPGGVVWLSRHDGLWGRTWEFRPRGDTLVGQSRVRTDVPSANPTPEPATAVRAAACTVPAADSATVR